MRSDKYRVAALVALGLAGFCGGALTNNAFRPIAAYAATSEQKAQARQDFDQLVHLLPGIDTAYASGNTAEAQSKYDAAKSKWTGVSTAISAREAREVQLLFQSLGSKLASKAPPSEVKRTVNGMMEELDEDIKSELR